MAGRSMIPVPQLAPTVSVGAGGFNALQHALNIYLSMRNQEQDNRRQQQATDQLNQYRQGELDFRNRQMGVLDQDRDEQRRLTAQARADALAEKKQLDDVNQAKWIAQNYGGQDIPGMTPDAQKPTVDLFNRAGLSSALDSKMTLPSHSLIGAMQADPNTDMPAEFSSVGTPTNKFVPPADTGLKAIRLTMDDKMRAATLAQAQKEAELARKTSEFTTKQDQFNRMQTEREHQNDTMNQIRDAQASARAAQIEAAAARAAQAASDRTAKQNDAKTDMERKTAAAKENAADTVSVIDKLSTHPGLSGIVGNIIPWSYNPKSQSAAALALYDNLQAKNMLGTIAELKSLSRSGATGFGNLSDAEGKVLRDAVGALSRKQPLESFQANLKIVREKLAKAAGLSSTDDINTSSPSPTSTPKYIDPSRF